MTWWLQISLRGCTQHTARGFLRASSFSSWLYNARDGGRVSFDRLSVMVTRYVVEDADRSNELTTPTGLFGLFSLLRLLIPLLIPRIPLLLVPRDRERWHSPSQKPCPLVPFSVARHPVGCSFVRSGSFRNKRKKRSVVGGTASSSSNTSPRYELR